MKKVITPLVIFLFILTTNCRSQTDFVHVDPSNVDQEELERAKILSDKLLTAQKNGGYYSSSKNEATPEMIKGLNETVQKESYKQIKTLFGDYKALNFESLMESMHGEEYKVYRFKGVFESDAAIEVRAVLNNKGELAGFFIKPWMEQL